jgi:membrane protease YdiL (CAAX protease family)
LPGDLHEFDHIAAGALALASVLQAFADPAAVKQLPRLAFFKAGAATGLIMGGLVLLFWHLAGRELGEFGLSGWPGPNPFATVLAALLWPLVLAVVAGLLWCHARAPATRFYASYAHLMPRSPREIPYAYAAGILGASGEEIAYRGFLIWYAQAFAGLPLAVLGTSLLFGLAHGYQSKFGMIFATVAGLILAGAYLLSGSLLLVIWMHASYNVASFTFGYRLLPGDRGGVDRAAASLQS